MIDSRHFRRLEQLYATRPTAVGEMHDVAVALGRAELNARIDVTRLRLQDVAHHAHYHDMLADAAALAAGSLVEEHVVMAEQFDMHVLKPGYSGEVTASARVTLVQPPHYRVEVQLTGAAGEVLARAVGIFARSTVELPPDPGSDGAAASSSRARPEPAVYATVWSTPFGLVHLN